MTSPKKIVVVGGTGMFGGSVARSLKDNPEFEVVLTTRDPNSPKASKCREEGFLLVKANSWNAAELGLVLAGAYGVFLNTDSDDLNFKNEVGPPESAMGKIVIDAAIRQNVKYFVFSGLPQSNRLTNGEVSILSFDNKTAIANYGRKAGFEAFVEVNCGWAMDIFFMETLSEFEDLSYGADSMDLRGDDYGDAVHAVFLEPSKYANHIIWAISDVASFQDVVDTYNRLTGTQVARFVPQTEPLKASTPGKTKEVNGLRNYCHYVQGKYCNNQVTSGRLLREMRALKAVATEARGKGHASTQSIDGFLRENAPVKLQSMSKI
ncbi:hypothetical protein N7530_008342 [Penicillium desertorum]|uniref:NmrA-like domain-containing protein n=1 Tax=Penicillium desertorum TaxID=1303715 RepID=A0A9W9WNW5_9EURO|nr:hypothetical protein N7530_008342 [Penicillium desertorum]